jgi:hypothetical protein
MSEIKPRPAISFKELGIGQVYRLDTYRTKNVWWQRIWKPKYNIRLYALTDKAIYDVTEAIELQRAAKPRKDK